MVENICHNSTIYSPVIFSPDPFNRKITFQSIEEIDRLQYSDDVILKKQPNWDKVHKNDISVMPFKKVLYYLFRPALVVILIAILLFKVILLHGVVPSESMETTIMTGEYLISNRLAYVVNEPKRGDIIVFQSNTEDSLYIKRVIGVAGDTIELFQGEVYINGCKLEDESFAQGGTWPLQENRSSFVVPENSVFVLGDNREHSGDSRMWENPFISLDAIKGKAIFKYSFSGLLLDITPLKSENLILVSDDFVYNNSTYNN